MSRVNKTGADRKIVSAGSMGNASVEISKHLSMGVVVAGTDDYAVAMIPRGAIITDVTLNAEAGLSASGTMDIGYDMGAGGTDVDYFVDGFNTVTGGKSPQSLGAPLECTEDCYIIATPLTGNTVVDKELQVVINYAFNGEV